MKKSIWSLLFIFHANFLLAQNPLVKQWDYRFGGNLNENLFSFQQTFDGGFIMGGSSASNISGDKMQQTWGSWDYWIVKMDLLGNKQWDKDFGGSNGDFLIALRQTSDGGYILGGYTNSDSSGSKTQNTRGFIDYWIVKTDSLGNMEWDKDFGGIDADFLSDIQQTSDNGYLLGGWSDSGNGGDKTQVSWGGNDYWVVKLDSLGNKQWDKSYGGISNDYLHCLQQTFDGGFILGGSSSSGIGGDKTQTTWGYEDYWIVKIDSLGNKQWDKDLGATWHENLYSIKQLSNGGFVLGGLSDSEISGDKTQPTWDIAGQSGDFWILKLDAIGNKEWDKDFGGANSEDEFGNISQTTDGGFLIAGTSYSNVSGDKTENNMGPEQTWVIKIDSLGIKQWDKTLRTNTTGDDEIGLAMQAKDGCYIMANATRGGIGGDKTQLNWDTICTPFCSADFWIIKFCDTTLSSIPSFELQGGISFLPNPATNKLMIHNIEGNIEFIEITNVMGETVLAKIFYKKKIIELDISRLESGVYFARIIAESKKAVVLKFLKI